MKHFSEVCVWCLVPKRRGGAIKVTGGWVWVGGCVGVIVIHRVSIRDVLCGLCCYFCAFHRFIFIFVDETCLAPINTSFTSFRILLLLLGKLPFFLAFIFSI